jgi:hypothetical protein
MNRLRTLTWLAPFAVLIASCAPRLDLPATPTPTQASMTMPTDSGMPMPTDAGHMVHEAEHGGQLGMGETVHIEIVSQQPGEYIIYLSDPSGDPLPLEGVTVELALIDLAGNELQVFPAKLSGDGKYFVAEGEPADPSNTDVRVKVRLPEGAEPVEMDFTLRYQP